MNLVNHVLAQIGQNQPGPVNQARGRVWFWCLNFSRTKVTTLTINYRY
jgi:hypothetical protein